MADRCLFFEDLLSLPSTVQKTYEVHDPGFGLVCLDARARQAGDWFYARRWVRAAPHRRELYRTLDRLEHRGFVFLVRRLPAGAKRDGAGETEAALDAFRVRASVVAAGYTAEERRLHRELFPEESDLLACGYDWDADHVYRDGRTLSPDPYGRLLEEDQGAVHEWVRVPEEFTWRRYPIGRVAADAISTKVGSP